MTHITPPSLTTPLTSALTPPPLIQSLLEQDRRFAHPAWQQNPLFTWQAAQFKLFEQYCQHYTAQLSAQPDATADQRKWAFYLSQITDALSPANYLATNPEAQQLAIETQGKSLQQGMLNLLHDLQRQKITQTDETAFAVGVNLAITAGQVVFENELMQLIQYTPTTPTIHRIPLLIVPPCINKFYILDLQAHNSFVKYALDQGIAVMMVSWRNIQDSHCTFTWEDYIQLGVIDAIHVTQAIAGVPAINTLGFCIGGTLLSCAAAILNHRAQATTQKTTSPIASLTLLTTLLDFSDTGTLGVLVDETLVQHREQQMGRAGFLAGKELSQAFNCLRPNDLLWNYVIDLYLKGQSPRAFDILYWNNDSTNLSGPMYTWYLRQMYLNNRLIQQENTEVLTLLDGPIALQSITQPVYALAAREDHIVPWQSAYASIQHIASTVRFVLAASGHIAGVINPPPAAGKPPKRSYWSADCNARETSLDQWQAHSSEQAGSWWQDWSHWLKPLSGESMPIPTQWHHPQFQPIEPAPGRYVQM
jgi:polyhydroxyalkanoate synthase